MTKILSCAHQSGLYSFTVNTLLPQVKILIEDVTELLKDNPDRYEYDGDYVLGYAPRTLDPKEEVRFDIACWLMKSYIYITLNIIS